MVGLLTAWRKSNPPGPRDWSWVRDFFAKPETQRLLEGGEPNRLNPEDIARRLCIDALVFYREAYQAGDNELAWQHLDHAKAIYRRLPECRTALRLALGKVWEAFLRMAGARKRKLLEDPFFDEIAHLADDLDADEIRASFVSMERSRIASIKPRGKRKRKKVALWERGLRCAFRNEGIDINPEKLKDRIDAEGGALIYDKPGDEYVELSVDGGDGVRVKDLKTRATKTITKVQLSIYFGRARERLRDENKSRNG